MRTARQRKLCFGAATAALFLSGLPTAAEVCDKVRPEWAPSDGSISQIDDLLVVFGSLPGASFLFLVAVSLLLRHKLLCAACAIVAVFWLLIEVPSLHVAFQDEMTRLAIAEGCRVPSYAVSAVVSACFLGSLLVWCFQRSKQNV